jgi:PAB1-binding protein PBP1
MARSQPAPTAAEEELAQREQGNQDTLAQRAKEEKAQQKQELRAGRRSPTTDIGDEPAELHRSDHVQLYTKTSGNRPDQYTQRNPAEEVAYGHFCTVTAGEHEGLYGVYVDNVSFKENGQPDVVTVRERGESVNSYAVYYDDLAPAQSRGTAPR